jgi:hypothetical protein
MSLGLIIMIGVFYAMVCIYIYFKIIDDLLFVIGKRRKIRIMLLAGGDLIKSFASYEMVNGDKIPVWLPSDVMLFYFLFLFFRQVFIIFSQLDMILGKFGCMIIERTGADVHDFLLSNQKLYEHRVCLFFFVLISCFRNLIFFPRIIPETRICC